MVVGLNGYIGSRFPLVSNNPLRSSYTYSYLKDFSSMSYAATFDPDNNLYIADTNRNRILIYLNPFEFQNLNLHLDTAIAASVVTLSWNALPVSEYQIWRSSSPYSGFALLQGGLTSPGLDVTIDPLTNYYYEVRALGASGGQPLAVSNRIGVFSFALVPGS